MYLVLSNEFNLPAEDLPVSLQRLAFGQCFNQPVDHLPASLTHLTFYYGYVVPNNDLFFFSDYFEGNASAFNKPIDFLPPLLTHLMLGRAFNQSVNYLPPHLTHLSFGSHFDQPVDHLPSTLTHLCLGADFNEQVDHLPICLTHFHIAGSSVGEPAVFDQPINNLPSSITHVSSYLFFFFICFFPLIIQLVIVSEFAHPFPKHRLPSLTHVLVKASYEHCDTIPKDTIIEVLI
jgi:FNIP Repeat